MTNTLYNIVFNNKYAQCIDLNCKKLLEGEVKHFNYFKNSDFHQKFQTLNLNVTPRNKQNCPQKQKKSLFWPIGKCYKNYITLFYSQGIVVF